MDPPKTEELLQRLEAGEEESLEPLLELHMEWLLKQVRQRLGPKLRERADSYDYTQEAALRILRYVPRIPLRSTRQFRGLALRILENSLRDQADYQQAQKRDARRERSLDDASELWTVGSQGSALDRRRLEGLLRIAIELLSTRDRQIVLAHDWDGLGFAQIAREQDLSADSVRMRYQRALPKLADLMRRLERGEISEILEEGESPKHP
jgi:RNA polymerase sigma factor (sigma-70 family)